MTVLARSQYDERPILNSDLSFVGDEGCTKKADAKDCDINEIFKKYERCGQLPDLIVRDGRYGDFSSVPDFQEALAIVRHAQEQFAALDVTIRNRFENDVEKFLDFTSREENLDEMERMGLLRPEAVEARRAARAAVDDANRAAVESRRQQDEEALFQRFKAKLAQG